MPDLVPDEHAMRAHNSPGDWEIAELADQQHGVVAYRQLVRVGLGRGAIQRRVTAGRLHRVHRGVYAVGHRLVTDRGRWMAAVLACGPGSVLSHRNAAAHRGLLAYSGPRIHVTAIGSRSRPGVVVHRVRQLHDDDRALAGNIPVTSIDRTLLDLAEVVPEQLDRALEAAERLGLFDLRRIEALVKRSPGRRGLPVLDDALRAYRDQGFTRSELERRFLRLCRDAGLPTPSTNVWIEEAACEVDVVWEDAWVVVELDSRSFHATRAAFERDRRRDAVLQVAGYRVIRVTPHRLDSEPEEILNELRALLGDAA